MQRKQNRLSLRSVMARVTNLLIGLLSGLVSLSFGVLMLLTTGVWQGLWSFMMVLAALFTVYWFATPLDKSKRGRVRKAIGNVRA